MFPEWKNVKIVQSKGTRSKNWFECLAPFIIYLFNIYYITVCRGRQINKECWNKPFSTLTFVHSCTIPECTSFSNLIFPIWFSFTLIIHPLFVPISFSLSISHTLFRVWHIVLRERKRKKESSEQKIVQGTRVFLTSPIQRECLSRLTFDLCGYWQRSPLPSYKWPPISHTHECTTVHLFLHRQDLHQDRSKDVSQFMNLVKMHQFLPVIVIFYIRLYFC